MMGCTSRKNAKGGVLIGMIGSGEAALAPASAPASAPAPSLYVSTRKNKKYALFNGCKTTHFGQLPYEDYTKHKNKTRRKNYLTRSQNIKGDWRRDSYSPNNLAIHLLW